MCPAVLLAMACDPTCSLTFLTNCRITAGPSGKTLEPHGAGRATVGSAGQLQHQVTLRLFTRSAYARQGMCLLESCVGFIKAKPSSNLRSGCPVTANELPHLPFLSPAQRNATCQQLPAPATMLATRQTCALFQPDSLLVASSR